MAHFYLIRRWWIVSVFFVTSFGCARGKPVPPHEGATPFESLAFSPDGKLLAAGRGTHYKQEYGTGEIAVWLTDTWDAPKIYNNDLTDHVAGVAFTADSSTLLAASDKYARKTGRNANPADNNFFNFQTVVGVPNLYEGNRIDMWDVGTGKHAKMLTIDWPQTNGDERDGSGHCAQTAFDPKTDLIVIGRNVGWTYAIDLKTGEHKHKIKDGSCSTVALSPDGKTLATTIKSGRVIQPKKFDTIPAISAYDVQLRESQTGKLLASLDIGEESREFAYSSDGRSLAYSSDGRLAVGCPSGKLLIISPDFKKIEITIQLTGDKPLTCINTIAFSPDGNQLAVAVAKKVSVIDPKKGTIIRTLEHPDNVNALAYSPDSKLLAAGYGSANYGRAAIENGTFGIAGPCGVNIWNAAIGDLKKELK